MRNDASSRTKVGRHGLRAVERTRRDSASQEAPALVAARTRLRQVAQDLRRNRQDLAELARGLRTTKPAPEDSRLCSGGSALSVEEWAADCADSVAGELVGLAELAETLARADWQADVRAWLDAVSPAVNTADFQK